MKSLNTNKLIATFDKFLFSGLGCGVFGLCILMGGFVFVWQNPPKPNLTSTPLGLSHSLTITSNAPTSATNAATPVPGVLTATVFPTFTSVVPAATIGGGTLPPSSIPTPVANIGNTSPPFGKIVFTCFVKQIDQICLMNADGSGRKQLTDHQATAFYPSLSPDGQTIYFASRNNGGFEIYSINLKGKGQRRLTRGIGALYAPELSPNGERIIFTNNTGGSQKIWIMRSDGKNAHALTNGPYDDIDPTWSPDGSFIAFASSRSGSRQLYVMERDGTDIRQVTNLPNMGGRSSWSADGTKLAFYAGPEGDHNIYIINVDGTGLVQLTNGGDNLGPSWSPDGNWIAFTSFRDGNNEIYIVRSDGRDLTRLTNSAISDWQPRWGR
jgi:Tol biopolymer transport system component